MEFTKTSLIAEGFEGFVTFRDLQNGKVFDIPKGGGAYVVFRDMDTIPTFLDTNPGGRFRRANSTVSKSELIRKWVNAARVIYIGAGDLLQRRMKQFISFGAGKPIGHWGGRFIWQVENSADFLVAWKPLQDGVSPEDVESALLHTFVSIYGRLPFANLRS